LKKKPLPGSADDKLDVAEYEKTHYVWSLYHYLGAKNSMMMGQMVMPVESLGRDLNAVNLIKELNSRNCFDFDYSPTAGDNFQIREEYVYKSLRGKQRKELYDYMSFIFRKGKWNEDVYNVFDDKTRKFRKGKVKFD
jgi:hypothetical protein